MERDVVQLSTTRGNEALADRRAGLRPGNENDRDRTALGWSELDRVGRIAIHESNSAVQGTQSNS